jgi:hypothetical protein
MTTREIEIRRAVPADARAAFDVCMSAMEAKFARANLEWRIDPEAFWAGSQQLFQHLAEHHAEWWVAESSSDGKQVAVL